MRRYNESQSHEKQKERVAQILEAKGWRVYRDGELSFRCKTDKGPREYWPDVYAENFSLLPKWLNDPNGAKGRYVRERDEKLRRVQKGRKRIIVEIQGREGHKSRAAFTSEKLRLQSIRQCHGADIQYYELNARNTRSKMDIRNWTDEEIAAELGLLP